jgi:anaerobic ribonucleoside-triphosphate reductase
MKIIAVLETLQECDPTQYLFTFPTFWYNITTKAMAEMIKYTYDGVHKLRNPAMAIQNTI